MTLNLARDADRHVITIRIKIGQKQNACLALMLPGAPHDVVSLRCRHFANALDQGHAVPLAQWDQHIGKRRLFDPQLDAIGLGDRRRRHQHHRLLFGECK